MNKLLFIFLIIFCVSCDQQTAHEKPVKEYSRIKLLRSYEFSYKGHKYIYFFKGGGKYESGGVVHDPNCCFKNPAF